jgi:SAM-dependent MidA family methyltransferase
MPPDNTGLGAGRNGQGAPARLSPHAMAHGERVREFIAGEISAAGGWWPFDRYMQAALYAPGLGYYSAGAHKLGASGDFTTAPEISGLFGACVARQCADVLRLQSDGRILEIGAGSGKLAVDVLRRLAELGALPREYLILEVSADLRDRQQRYIREHAPHEFPRVSWVDAPPSAPFDGVILANEVLDALPVTRFRWSPGKVYELGVAHDGAGFHWSERLARDSVIRKVDSLARTVSGDWQSGYVSEFCPHLAPWTAEVTRALRAGVVLWIDYGLPRRSYYLGERHEGTLLCHHWHRAFADPFALPGLSDITAWVDFTAVAEAGSSCGFDIAGFTTQAYFLAGAGIDVEMQHSAAGQPNKLAALAQQAKQLMMPGEMGERFKFMAWTRGFDAPLAGFRHGDLRHTL